MRTLLQKWKKASPAVKASMALLFSNIFLKGLSLISGPIFTRIMSADQYGVISTFGSWQSLLSVVVTLNLATGVFNNGMLDYKDHRDTFQFSLLTVSSISAVLFFLLFCCFSRTILEITDLSWMLVVILFLRFLLAPAYSYWSGRQRYEFRYKALTGITIGSALLSTTLGIIAVLSTEDQNRAIVKICVTEGVTILVGLFFYIRTAIKAKFKCNLSYCKYALRFNIPLVPHYLSTYILASSDRIMISKIVSTAATAIYSVSYTVASVMTILWQSIEASLSPWIYEKLSKGEKEPVNKLTLQITGLFAVMCLGCTLFAPEIMSILAPSQYMEGIYAIPSIAAGVYFTAVYSLYMRVELYYKETGFATLATTLAALVNIILNLIFIKLYGFIAAGYTTMICYALLALFHYVNIKRRKHEDVFDNRKIWLISALVLVISGAINMVYSMPVFRAMIILVVVLMLILKRKQIIAIFSNRKKGQG